MVRNSYLEKGETTMLQLSVKVININLTSAHPLLSVCRPLYEYSWFTWKVREHLSERKSRDDALAMAMDESVRQGIMTEFIAEHGSEVRNMLFTEFNLEDAREVWQEEAREDGKAEGILVGRNCTLIEQTTRKLRRGKTPEVIAKELEADEGEIQAICRAAEAFAPDYDTEAIFEAMRRGS